MYILADTYFVSLYGGKCYLDSIFQSWYISFGVSYWGYIAREYNASSSIYFVPSRTLVASSMGRI